MNVYKTLVVFFAVIFVPFCAFTQTKFEKEYRIKPEEVPEKARQFLYSHEINFSEKWYFEENKLGNSVEAKLKYNKKKYSVEFDTLGTIQDIEVETDFNEIAESTQSKITTSLQKSFSKYKIRKLQVQYSGEIKSFIHFLKSTNPMKNFMVRYELIVKGKNKDGIELYEITFNENGEMIKTEKIIFRNTDNLEF